MDEEEEKLELLFNRKAGYEEEGRRLREDSLNVQDIRDNRNAILQMDEYIAYQKVQVSKAEAELEKERQKLKEAMQERKIQEKLRENAFEAFMKEENAPEPKPPTSNFTKRHRIATHTITINPVTRKTGTPPPTCSKLYQGIGIGASKGSIYRSV